MRLFKRHESKETMGLEAGMKECLSCYRNVRCTECDYEDENNIMKAQIARLKIENQALRGAANSYKIHYENAVKNFEEFAQHAYMDNPFACQYCVHSVENGRACLWKAEHEDDEEGCFGRHFEYKGE